MPGNPLPTDGVVGRLTTDQEKALKAFWLEFLQLVDQAPTEGSGPKAANEPAAEKPGKDIPKDDAAKERLKAEQEMADAKAAFVEYGSRPFLESYWRFASLASPVLRTAPAANARSVQIAMDDPDSIMLRFMRARKWSVSAGVAMLAACIKWRMGSDVEMIFEKGEEGMQNAEGFIKQMEIGKTYTQGTDRYGRPVMCALDTSLLSRLADRQANSYIHVAKHRTFDQSPKALEDFVLFQMEIRRGKFIISAVALGSPEISSVRHDWFRHSQHWRCILFIVKCLEAYYPESLNVMLIHNAPWVFQGIWKLLAPMLDPVVRNKIQMTKSTDDLLQHIPKVRCGVPTSRIVVHVSMIMQNHLVKELGGSSEWRWKYPPVVPGENAPQKYELLPYSGFSSLMTCLLSRDLEGKKNVLADRSKLIDEYIAVTREWAKSSDPSIAKKREAVVYRLRAQYYELDPFIRGRGAYHRNGNVNPFVLHIVGNGLVVWNYPAASGEKGEGEWEVRGYETCREECLLRAKQIDAELSEA
ncbi:SPOSA6832_00970, partial [Sporobolomyces salmonicolor]